MKQVTIAFLVALAIGASIGLLIAPAMDQADRALLLFAGSLILALLLGGVILWINSRER